MTRTERNQYPAALLKDRRSRSGLANGTETARKNGAGAHNWGSLNQEGEYEFAADADARRETDADAVFDMEGDNVGPLPPKPQQEGADGQTDPKDIIATSPSDSMSSFDSELGNHTNQKPGMPQRRMSNVTDEERERARVYREGGVKQNGIDLAHIARTSYGIAQSPPSGGAGVLSTSPNAAKNSLNMKQ